MIGMFAVLGAYSAVATVKNKLCSGASAITGMFKKKKSRADSCTPDKKEEQ